MANSVIDVRRHKEDLELLALFDADCPMDPYPLFDRDALFGKSELEAYDADRDIEEWLNSIMTVDEQLVKLLEEQTPAPKAPAAPKAPSISRPSDEKFNIPRLYTCRFCQRRFYNKASRDRHVRVHARRQLRCSRCGFSVRNIDALERHTNYFHRYVNFRAHLPSF